MFNPGKPTYPLLLETTYPLLLQLTMLIAPLGVGVGVADITGKTARIRFAQALEVPCGISSSGLVERLIFFLND